MLKLGILVSGGGTNLQAILDAIEEKKITNAEAAVVISNNAGAYALERARKKGIPAECISPKNYETREDFHRALLDELRKKPGGSCSAGRISGGNPSDDRGGVPQPDHQYPSVPDPFLLRNWFFMGLRSMRER